MLLSHHRDIVETVEIGQRLEIGLVLDQLLGTAVQQPDMGIGALDDLAVHLENQAQHAMRRGMLRSEVERDVLDLNFSHLRCPPSRRPAGRIRRSPTGS